MIVAHTDDVPTVKKRAAAREVKLAATNVMLNPTVRMTHRATTRSSRPHLLHVRGQKSLGLDMLPDNNWDVYRQHGYNKCCVSTTPSLLSHAFSAYL